MGIKSFFKKVGKGLAKAGRWAWGGIKKAGRWVADKGLKVAGAVTGVAKFLPGKIGAIAGAADKGIGKLKELVSLVPKGKVKDKLEKGVEKVQSVKDTVEKKAHEGAGYVQKAADVANTVVDKGKQAAAIVTGKSI